MEEKPTSGWATKRNSPPDLAPGDTLARASELRRLLLGWYDAKRRDLPWRGESDPYRVWVSEIMLQQTQVETVIPYYKEWMGRFPDLDSLAEAEEDEVLRVWQGLGYYSRARNLLGAARVVKERYRGEVPTSASELKTLPGIGEYTAGAVASIAFGEVIPAVDGNVRRVLARLFDEPDPTPADLRALAGGLVDPNRPGDFNQAFMELGAVTCKPRAPMCPECPLAALCRARMQGTQLNRPIAKKGKEVPTREEMVVVATVGRGEDRRFLLRKRPPGGLLAGMWEFPSHELPDGSSAKGVASGLCRKFGLSSPPLPLESVSHVFSHLKVRYHPFLFQDQAREIIEASGQWLLLTEATRVPLSVAQRKILEAALNRLEILGKKVRTNAGEDRS